MSNLFKILFSKKSESSPQETPSAPSEEFPRGESPYRTMSQVLKREAKPFPTESDIAALELALREWLIKGAAGGYAVSFPSCILLPGSSLGIPVAAQRPVRIKRLFLWAAPSVTGAEVGEIERKVHLLDFQVGVERQGGYPLDVPIDMFRILNPNPIEFDTMWLPGLTATIEIINRSDRNVQVSGVILGDRLDKEASGPDFG